MGILEKESGKRTRNLNISRAILKTVGVAGISQSFWQKLSKLIMALAPMADVTDAAFYLEAKPPSAVNFSATDFS